MPNDTSPSAAYRPAHQGFPGTLPEPTPKLTLVPQGPRVGDALHYLETDGTIVETFTVGGVLYVVAEMAGAYGLETWGPMEWALVRANGGT